MAITFVGSTSGNSVSGANITLSLSGVAGIATGDFVYIMSGMRDRAGNEGRIGNALGFTPDVNTTSGNQRGRTAWKNYVSGTDGSCIVEGSTNAQDAMAAVALVFRGHQADSPLSTATTTVTGSSTNPDPPSITPLHGGCAIIAMATSLVQDTTPSGTVTNYLPATPVNNNATDNNASTVAGMYRIMTGAVAAENPGAFTSWTTGAWIAVTAALTPRVQVAAQFAGSGALAADVRVNKRILAQFAGAGSLVADITVTTPVGATNHVVSAAFAGSGSLRAYLTTPTQLLRPDADSVDGNWTNELDTTTLFSSIDETTIDDADYIKSGSDPAADVCRLRLSNPGSAVSEPMKVRVRYKREDEGSLDLTMRLLQGSSEVASWTYSDIPDEFVTVEESITPEQFDSISDFDDLFVELQADVVDWRPIRIGGGGFTTGLDIHPDGTKVCRIDVFGAYKCSVADPVWRQLVTESSMPSADIPPTATITDGGVGVYEIAIAPSDSSRFYMMWNNRVYISSDQGETWTRTNFPTVTENNANGGTQKLMGRKMAVDPANADVCYVGTVSDGLYQTLNAGSTWTSMTSAGVPVPTGGTNSQCVLIVFDTTSSVSGGKTQGIYASSYGNGVYHTTNGGTSWSLTSSGPTTHRHMICDQNGAIWLSDNTNDPLNVWKYSGSWTHISTNTYPAWSIAVDRSNANNIYLGRDGGEISTSTDGGATWTPPNFDHTRSAVDVPWLAWTSETYMSNGDQMFDYSGNLYFAEGIGVWKTDAPLSSGNVWKSQTAGIESLVATWICSSPSYEFPILCAWDRPVWHLDGLSTYPSEHGAVQSHAIILGAVADYASSDDGLTMCWQASWFTEDDSGITPDNGVTWNEFTKSPIVTPLTTNAATAVGNAVLHFASVPSDVVVGMVVGDITNSSAISDTARVQSISGGDVTLDTNILSPGVSSGDVINFYAPASHGGLAMSSPTNVIWVSSNQFWFPRVTVDGGATWSNISITGVPRAMVGTLNSSTSVVVADSSNFVIGGGVSGTGIPANTTVSAKPDGTHITLSQAATITGTTVLLPESGWGFAYFASFHPVCADRVTANKFYLYNSLTNKLYVSTNSGATWSDTGATGLSGGGAGTLIRAVPGHAGHLLYTAANYPFLDSAIKFSTNSGATFTSMTGVSNVRAFGIGAAAPGGTYDVIYAVGDVGGDYGIWQADDFDPSSNTPTWVNIGTYPGGNVDTILAIEGDRSVYGRVYVAFQGSSWAWRGPSVSEAIPPSFTATYGDAQNIGFGSTTYTTPTVTIGTGVFVVYLQDDIGRVHSSVTIGGVAATMVAETSDHKGSMWYASTSTATGTIVVTSADVFACIASCGGLLTGVDPTPTASGIHNTDFGADPQTVTATVPAGGFGIVGMGVEISGHLPASWSNATRDAVTEAEIATGNMTTVCMAHTSTAGSQSPAVSGTGGNGFGFAGADMVMGCWEPL